MGWDFKVIEEAAAEQLYNVVGVNRHGGTDSTAGLLSGR